MKYLHTCTHTLPNEYFQKLQPTDLEIDKVTVDVSCQIRHCLPLKKIDLLNLRINSKNNKHLYEVANLESRDTDTTTRNLVS